MYVVCAINLSSIMRIYFFVENAIGQFVKNIKQNRTVIIALRKLTIGR